jgi:hypothetical protein
VRRRKSTYEDNRPRPDALDTSQVVEESTPPEEEFAIVDEKKRVKGAPSRRSGRRKPKPQ